MKRKMIALIAVATTYMVAAHSQETLNRGGAGAASFSDGSNLPVEKMGKDDLIGVTVYDAPELTRTVRVGSDGNIRLPILRLPISAAGLYPTELEASITNALIHENVLVHPIVTVSVVEYRSRPITVSGAVKSPVTFQSTGTVTLLDAISRAGGLAENAGAEILVSKQSSADSAKPAELVQRISVRELLGADNTAQNMKLEGGEDIRVPEAGRVFVVGRVKKPGAFYITDGSESSVLKALSLSEGLDSFPSHKAYIYRSEGEHGSRTEIPVQLKEIMNRKSADVALMPNDILYVPDATGVRASLKVLEATVGFGAGITSALIYTYR